jgi:hypothetical protein
MRKQLCYLELRAIQSACTWQRMGASVLVMTSALSTRGRRAPCAGRKGSEHVKALATRTPALRHAAAQQSGAFYVRSAQAGQQVCLCDELQGAALHAARLGSVLSYVPLLKHRCAGVAVRRHAIRAQVHRGAEARRVLDCLGGRQALGRGRRDVQQ